MISPSLLHLFQVLLFSLLLTQSFSKNDRKTYIVYMGEYPTDMESAESLHTNMIQSVVDSEFASDALLHSYKSFNALVARLTKDEAEIIRGMEGVVSVIPDRKDKIQTTRSWNFLGFPENVTRNSAVESDIVVGVIDTGIWPSSESFNDRGFGPPPQKWKGSCQNITCNNKIVGARYFRMNRTLPVNDIASPVDTEGHGSHCASTAAGNPVQSANLLGFASGTARGGVPLAHIAAYKVCWSDGCSNKDILHAFDRAIIDRVDIISVSVGPTRVTRLNYFQDIYAIGSFHAMKKGILTSTSADNNGPNYNSTSKLAPWLCSVAASTIDRKFSTDLQLGNGNIYKGTSINTFNEIKDYPIIYGGDAPNVAAGHNGNLSRHCREDSLDPALVKGKIVFCYDNLDPSYVGLAQGAAGLIIASLGSLNVSNVYALPVVHIGPADAPVVFSYLNSTRNPTATIFKSVEGKDPLAPYVVPFSSRGPNAITPEILKPDIAAPGVDILAAWSPYSPFSLASGDKRRSNFNIIYGTSMACPHVTAAAVYVKSFHCNWSPAAIKSALMTTATPMSNAINPEAEFAYGAGQVNPIKAVNPGLVYDANETDYVNFLCGQGYITPLLRLITKDKSVCTQANKIPVSDLNLPSFALRGHRLQNNAKVTFRRTVTNVGSATSKYKATITAHPSTLKITVVPNIMQFSSPGERKVYNLTIEGSISPGIVSSSLVWDDGTFQVRSPIVVYM